MTKPRNTKASQTKSVSPAQRHREGLCGCSIRKNPTSCVYQPFLDGWNFTPDVGNGGSRGEVFTPRFVVDKMIVEAGIMPAKTVNLYKYDYGQDTLRKYIGARVFEPAVGTGNFTATILWHKLEMAHRLTGFTVDDIGQARKNASQLRRYQAYTLVALASLYFNDIDAGNLQVTKWRLLRDGEIGSDRNIDFWTNYLVDHLDGHINYDTIRPGVMKSIKSASDNWGNKDKNGGVLDELYERHTGLEAPDWLHKAWKLVLDANAQLFNGINAEDEVSAGFTCPGYRRVTWTFWYFNSSRDSVKATRVAVPLVRQILAGELLEVREQLARIPLRPSDSPDGLFELEPVFVPVDKTAAQLKRKLESAISKIESDLMSSALQVTELAPLELLPQSD